MKQKNKKNIIVKKIIDMQKRLIKMKQCLTSFLYETSC